MILEKIEVGEEIQCNRCMKNFPVEREVKRFPFQDGMTGVRVADFVECPHCNMTDMHWYYQREK